ncbi:tyrosine-type recombinase/integrase [Catelliglobosispora koreensis]|uniref:tyrosine-type recombinase/integrase n=1 Tax=Catelliglobosispora koreensis TaxID=129052 RepID=UPI000688E15B|nr:tyrosine-type recombinase/integrase [Catelliglobosispora koreensis]
MLQAHDHDFVFIGSRRGVVRHNALDKVWRRAMAETVAQLGNQAIRGLHFHDLRGSHKTWLLEDDMPLVAQYARLGHRLKGVEGIYGHSTPQMEHDISKALQNRWEDSGGSVFAAALVRTIASHKLAGGPNLAVTPGRLRPG